MTRLLALAGVFLLFPCGAFGQSQTQTGTALNNLYAFGRIRGAEVKGHVVGIVGFFGRSLPADWRFLVVDSANRNVRHEYIMKNGREIGQRHFQVNPAQDIPSIPIPLKSLKVDSERAFDIANEAAKAAGVGFDSMHYQLRCRDLRNEPVWLLTPVDRGRKAVGVVYLSAMDGKILRASWNPSNFPNRLTSNSTPTPLTRRGIFGN
jgi:hypothetical protein